MKLKYAVVYERTPNNYGAYVPDLPGCISTGKTWEEIRENIQEAIAFHLEGIQESGEPVPEPQTMVGMIEVKVVSMNELSSAVGGN